MERPLPTPTDPARPSFRRRLVRTLLTLIAAALAAFVLTLWGGLYVWMVRDAYRAVDVEMQFIASRVVTPDGRLTPEAYAWDEPHHRFASEHVDPYFVQIFSPDRRLLRQSDNVTFFPAGAFPDRLLATETAPPRLLPSLRTFSAAGGTFYHVTRPLRDRAGDLLGYLQVARREPGIARLTRRVGLVLGIGWAVTLLGLGLLVWWQAGRVLRPLAHITAATRDITPAHLSRRVPLPPDADRETAQLADTLNRQLDQLERSFEEMGRFTSNAAHQLQTPLTILRGHVDVALRRDRPPAAYRQTLDVVGREIDSLTRTVRGLLLLARFDRDAGYLPLERVDLSGLVAETVPAFEAAARARGLTLTWTPATDAHVCGRRALLHEVVANLLDNAVKYTEQGRVEVALAAEDGWVDLAVTDTGVGMEPEAAARATERFYRGDAADARGAGSGLGLSIVTQIVEHHAGRVHLTSTPHQGTRVRVRLPRCT